MDDWVKCFLNVPLNDKGLAGHDTFDEVRVFTVAVINSQKCIQNIKLCKTL